MYMQAGVDIYVYVHAYVASHETDSDRSDDVSRRLCAPIWKRRMWQLRMETGMCHISVHAGVKKVRPNWWCHTLGHYMVKSLCSPPDHVRAVSARAFGEKGNIPTFV